MVLIRFPDANSKRQALGSLAGRFTFKIWATGEMIVTETALAHLTVADIPFFVEGQATYERLISTVQTAPAANKH